MTTTINFVPGRTKGSRNFIHEGHLYCLDKKGDDKTYWRCSCSLKACSGRLNLLADNTVTGTKPHMLLSPYLHRWTPWQTTTSRPGLGQFLPLALPSTLLGFGTNKML